MMMIDKDKAYDTIMERRREKDGSVSQTQIKPSATIAEGGEIDPRHTAMEDFHRAIKEGHIGKMTEAMSAFHDLHSMQKDKS